MLIAKEKSGHHTSDEAYKMAVTDAISVALKSLGVAADVYMGKADGSKYSRPTQDGPNKLTSADWEKRFDKEVKTFDEIAAWRDKHRSEVKKMDATEVKKLLAYIEDMSLVMAKEIIEPTCPEDNNPIVKEKCADCAKQQGCPALESK